MPRLAIDIYLRLALGAQVDAAALTSSVLLFDLHDPAQPFRRLSVL